MRKPKFPGELLMKMQSKKMSAKKTKHKKIMGFTESYLKKEAAEPPHSKMSKKQLAHEATETPAEERKEHMAVKMMEESKAKRKHKSHKKYSHKAMHKVKRMKPKGKKGMAQVKKLGRTYKTGGFAKIASKAAKKYGSKETGKKVAGAIFQKMVKARGKHRVMCKKPHKHTRSCK